MALKFMTTAASKAAASTPSQTTKPQPAQSAQPLKKPGTISFLKTGQAAREALAAEEAKAELAKEAYGKLWRFRMKEGEDRRITFLDGDLTDEGMLDITMFYEHTLAINGGYENFICTADVDQTQPCPICQSGSKPAYVGVMTVIDHTPHEIKQGPNKGNIIVNQKKLFVCKMGTRNQLQKLAANRGGLAGCTFDAYRTGEKDAAVGNQFDFVEKFESYDDIAQKYGLELEAVQPVDYGSELVYRSPDELLELGIGKAVKSSFGSKSFSSSKLSSHL